MSVSRTALKAWTDPPAALLEANAPAKAASAEQQFRGLLGFCIAAAAVVLAVHAGVALWAQHEFTQVESIIALHSIMFANGGGLYYGLNSYPFTVSPYGPIFYGLLACMHQVGVPPLLGGRLISITALVVELWLAWRILGLLISNRYARVAGVLLAASICNVAAWATVGQTDTLACCFSLGAFWQFLNWREHRRNTSLFASALLVFLAIFTKQTAVAAGAAISICLVFEDQKIAAKWIVFLGIASLTAMLALNTATHGHYYEDAALANINPFRAWKLGRHLTFFLGSSAGTLIIALAGLRYAFGRLAPVYVYTGLAACLWLATCPKVGSDTNYQIETGLLLTLCVACTLDQLSCFPKLFAGSTIRPALLLVPLTLNACLNLFLSEKTISERISNERLLDVRDAEVAPFLRAAKRRVISVEFDPLLKYWRRIDVEPLIYTLLVRAGKVDPTPVLEDLEARRFSLLVLNRDVFLPPARWENEETLSLTDEQMEAVRRNYKLVKHVNSPYLDGDYIYEPRSD